MTECCCMPLDRLVEPAGDANRVRRAAFEALRAGRAAPLGDIADQATLLVDGQPLPARAYVIATGAQPAVPEVSGITEVDYLTSTTAMDLDTLPESLVVIGGGPVGMEQAQLFAHLGTSVTMVGRLAPRAEPELAASLHAVFDEDGITVVDERAVAVQPGERGVDVVTESGRRASGGVKIVADADSGRVLGVHALADGAGEMMLAATYAIKARFTIDELADTWAPYLSMAESLRLTAGLFRDDHPTSCA